MAFLQERSLDKRLVLQMRSLLRRHWLFAVAIAAGVVLRVMTTLAYRPVLLFPDSGGYLKRAFHLHMSETRPIGYSVFLAPIVRAVGVGGVAPVQHVLGIAAAVAIYLFLLRKGLPAWAAALAIIPLAIDPLQLVVEQYALSDLLFQMLILAACLLLLWGESPPTWAVVVAALLISAAGLTRGAGFALVVPLALAAVAFRLRWTRIALIGVALIPYVVYAAAFHAQHKHFAIVESGPRFLYARIAPLAHCANLPMPAYERPLCPSQPVGQRPDSDYYMWSHHASAQWHLHPPKGITELAAVSDFDKRVIRAQPTMFVSSSLYNLMLGFSPTRLHSPPGFSAQDWRFHAHYWSLDRFYGVAHARYNPRANRALAGALTDFQRYFWTPGPLLFALLLVAGVAMLGFGRSRRAGTRIAIGLLLMTCVISLATTAALSGPDWRYTLPQLALLPPAGALGLAALLRKTRSGPVPWSPTASLARRFGLPYLACGLGASVLLGVLTAAALFVSGWFAIGTATLVGVTATVVAGTGTAWTRVRHRHDPTGLPGLV
jgi:hypothetical protein